MISTRFFRAPLHENADPAQRVLGVAELAPDSAELARLLAGDPAPEVRAAAARRTGSLPALKSAWNAEADPAVREALAEALATVVAETPDEAAAGGLLAADNCTDAVRAAVALKATEGTRRALAIGAIHDEAVLVDLALTAGHAETRLAAAERVHTPESLRRLAEGASGKDRGVTRLAQKRLDAMKDRAAQEAEADDVLSQLESLATTPGPVLTAVVALNRRWQALDMAADAARLARVDAARTALHARFEREQAEQLAKARFDRRVRDWSAALVPPGSAEALEGERAQLATLTAEAQAANDATALEILAAAGARIEQWGRERELVASAEALVIEAEKLAADTSIDDANLPARWQGLDRAIRTPDLSRRFEAALIVVEQRRLAQVALAQEEAGAARQKVHALLHTAEEALAAGQTAAARVAADAIRVLKASSGNLPKPTIQRLSRVVQQLGDLERWEAFGQHEARVRLCERAEALAVPGGDPAKVATEVKKVRDEWKALDAQHAGVPKSLWERFDGACERAYAPAARHFAEQAQLRKVARKAREEYIEKASLEAQALLAAEPRDLRALEKWLRETDRHWREGGLGSVDMGMWKKLDAKIKEALAPARQALGAARDEAKTGRQALIDEVVALAEKAMDRDTPSKVKAIQLRWQAEAKAHPIAQRDERVLWEKFRAACDAVFSVRSEKRKAEDAVKGESRKGLEELVEKVEQLAKAGDKGEGDIRRELREAEDQWRKQAGRPDPSLRGVEGRFRNAKSNVEAALFARAKAKEAEVWKTFAAKERLCEALDAKVAAGATGEDGASIREQWDALPGLPGAQERKLLARRDGALKALADAAAAPEYKGRIEKGTEARTRLLLDLEMALGLETPPEYQAQRLQLQVARLRERFQSAAASGAGSNEERVIAWASQPGVADARDRGRFERILAKLGPAR